MDEIAHLSHYDRERVCVPQICNCSQETCRYRFFLEKCDSGRYLFQICNHNLLLADAIHRGSGRKPILPDTCALIVDEAHKLPETARQMFGVTLAADLGVEDHIRVALVKQGHAGGDVLQPPAGGRREQAVELPVDHRQAPLRCGQRCFVVDEGPVLRRAVQLPQQALGAVVQDFCSQQEAFPSQTVGLRLPEELSAILTAGSTQAKGRSLL